jgi:hypothetical protein
MMAQLPLFDDLDEDKAFIALKLPRRLLHLCTYYTLSSASAWQMGTLTLPDWLPL